MRAPDPIRSLPANWFGKGLLRAVILLAAAAAVAAAAGAFGTAHDYGYLRASILTDQQALIDQATTTVAALRQGAPGQPEAQAKAPHVGGSSDGLRG